MRRQRIIIDMDGVLADTLPLWLMTWNEISGEVLQVADITEYEFGKFVNNPEQFFELLNSDEIFIRSLPMPGAVEALEQLNEKFEVLIATYVIAGSGFTQKLEWLAKWCPFIDPKQVIFISPAEKARLDADFLVEDNPATFDVWAETVMCLAEQAAYLVDHPYNRSVVCEGIEDGRFRVAGLGDVAAELCK